MARASPSFHHPISVFILSGLRKSVEEELLTVTSNGAFLSAKQSARRCMNAAFPQPERDLEMVPEMFRPSKVMMSTPGLKVHGTEMKHAATPAKSR
ncbi:hypothetical protein CEXT_330611 [Caerostris extrusa]|uniref:Uncharacterized protein n=1 Tax=Caerostris extrusa TaxID=172846 RepID=A0AAV4SE37_CAEEX|nr:hypothetical protein CEXT_330611 [Caerostris extrusa]